MLSYPYVGTHSRLQRTLTGLLCFVAMFLFASPVAAQSDVLPSGGVLGPNQYLRSQDGRYQFTNQGDGNLVLHVEGYYVWDSGTTGQPGNLVMQGDGNLVLYRTDGSLWDSHTNALENEGAYLIVQNDGNVVLHRADGAVIKSITNSNGAQPPSNWMGPGGRRYRGQEIASPNGRYRLKNQASDGNLVLYVDGYDIWQSGHHNVPGDLMMQHNGDLVLTRDDGTNWSTPTEGHDGAHLEVLDSGNVEIREPWGALIWSTETTGGAPPTEPPPPTPLPTRLTINGLGAGEIFNIRRNQSFTVHVENAQTGDDTLKFYLVNGPMVLAPVPMGGQKSGDYTFVASSPTPGRFLVSLYGANGGNRIADGPFIDESVPILSVNGKTATQTVYLATGQDFTVDFDHAPGSVTDWIGLYPAAVTQDTTGFVAWWYLDGDEAAPVEAHIDGTLNLKAPLTAGTYQLRMFSNDSFDRVATGPFLQVTKPNPTLTIRGYSTNQVITIRQHQTVWVDVLNAKECEYETSPNCDYLRFRNGETGQILQPRIALSAEASAYVTANANVSGRYQVVLIDGMNEDVLAVSQDIYVNLPAIRVNGYREGETVLPRFSSNDAIEIAFTYAPGDPGDYIVLSGPNDSYVGSWYLNCLQNPPASAKIDGVLGAANQGCDPPVRLGIASGTYLARMYAAPTGALVATGPFLWVDAATVLTVNGRAAPDEVPITTPTFFVHVENGTGFSGDWIGLYPEGAPDTGYSERKYLATNQPSPNPPAAKTRGDVSFTTPVTPGRYQVRFFMTSELDPYGDGQLRAVGPYIRVGANSSTFEIHIDSRKPGQLYPVAPGAPLEVKIVGGTFAGGERIRFTKQSTGAIPINNPVNSREFPLAAPTLIGDYDVQLFSSAGVPIGNGPIVLVQSSTPPAGVDTIYYYDTDVIGSVRLITDKDGNQVARKDYLPFGSEWNASSTSIGDRVKFGGTERDPDSGLDYMGARYYSMNIGRFTAPDVPGADQYTDEPQSWNLFAYGRNNPLRFTDPGGRQIIVAGGSSTEIDIDSNREWREWLKDKFSRFSDPINALFWPVTRAEQQRHREFVLGADLWPAMTSILTAPRVLLLQTARGNLLGAARNPRLRDAITNLYRPGARLGNGSSMDAVRIDGSHVEKVLGRRTQLQRILREENLDASDTRIVKELLMDIQDALGMR